MSGWTCSTAGYASGAPAYLSLAGAGNGGRFYPSGLEVWTYSGGTWSPFSADDLAYEAFASFTVTSFGSFAVTGVAVMPSDANRDGQVDINDLTIVLSNFGQTGMTWSQGDFNDDGTVDINALTIRLTNFGQTAGANIKAVPEPSSYTLLLASAACFFRVRFATSGWLKSKKKPAFLNPRIANRHTCHQPRVSGRHSRPVLIVIGLGCHSKWAPPDASGVAGA